MDTLKTLLETEEFSSLLDSKDSLQMADFLNEISKKSENSCLKYINNLFKDLNIFQDIAICNFESNKKYNYVLSGACTYPHNPLVNICGTCVYSRGVFPVVGCNIIIDNKTILDDSGIRIYANDPAEKFTLTFLGIPQFNCRQGIFIDIGRGGDVEIQVKSGLKDKIEKLINEERILIRGYATISGV